MCAVTSSVFCSSVLYNPSPCSHWDFCCFPVSPSSLTEFPLLVNIGNIFLVHIPVMASAGRHSVLWICPSHNHCWCLVKSWKCWKTKGTVPVSTSRIGNWGLGRLWTLPEQSISQIRPRMLNWVLITAIPRSLVMFSLSLLPPFSLRDGSVKSREEE